MPQDPFTLTLNGAYLRAVYARRWEFDTVFPTFRLSWPPGRIAWRQHGCV